MPDYEHLPSSTNDANMDEGFVDEMSKAFTELVRRIAMASVARDAPLTHVVLCITTAHAEGDGVEKSSRLYWNLADQVDDTDAGELGMLEELLRHTKLAGRRVGLHLDLRKAGETVRRAQRRQPGRRRGPQDHRGH